MIATHALALDEIMVTNNTREFERVQGLRSENRSEAGSSIKSIHSSIIKKQADSAFRISSSKPSIEELTAKMSYKEKEFRLINLPFYLINQLERFTRQL